MRKCRLCGSLIRRKAEFCRFCTAPQAESRAATPADITVGAVEGSAPHWMPAGNAKDAPTNGSDALTLPAAEPQWTPELVEPRDAIVDADIEAQLLASDVERATERQDYRERTMASPSLDVTPPMQAPLPDPPAPPMVPDDPPVTIIATVTAPTNDRAVIGHTEGNGNGTSNGNANDNDNSNGNGHANGARNKTSNGNGHANDGASSDDATAQQLVGFAHFPDATAAPKIRWR